MPAIFVSKVLRPAATGEGRRRASSSRLAAWRDVDEAGAGMGIVATGEEALVRHQVSGDDRRQARARLDLYAGDTDGNHLLVTTDLKNDRKAHGAVVVVLRGVLQPFQTRAVVDDHVAGSSLGRHTSYLSTMPMRARHNSLLVVTKTTNLPHTR